MLGLAELNDDQLMTIHSSRDDHHYQIKSARG